MTDPAKLLFFSNSFNSFENSEYFVTTKPHDWNEKDFLLWLDKNGEDLFAGSRTLQDRIMKWHIHFLKVLEAVISNCKGFLDNPTRITTEDDELRSYASAAMNKAVFLSKNLKKIPNDVSEWWNRRELENFKGREKLIMAQDSLSQVSWTAARNEKTRKRFWEIDALGDDGTKHDEQAGRDFPEKRAKIDHYFQRKQDQIPRTPPHQIGVSRAFQEDSEQIQAHDNISKDSNPENDTSEDDLLMESPVGIAMDCKLIVKNICVRSKMEQCRRSLRYVEEIHKQDLMRYNILDTTSSSATEAQKIFKESWDDIISTIEGFLMSASTSPSSSFSASNLTDQDTEHDGQAEEIKQLNTISKNVNTAEKLRNTVKTKLLADGKTKWKRRVLQLMKIFRDQFPDGRNCLKEDQTEYNYIITFISHIFTTLFKDRMPSVRYKWGESTLKCSAILLNQSIKDDDRRCTGNKIDAILSMVELDLEFSTLEVSGSPSSLDHTHYVGDRNKTAKMLKVILNFIKTKYQGDFEKFRKIKVYGIQIYDHDFYIYSLCMPFAGVYYFKLEKKFSYPTMTFLLFKDLPIFALNLWKMRDMITLSTENIIDYVTSAPTEFCNDDTVIDKVKSSPRKKKE